MFLLHRGLLNGGTSSPTPKMLLTMLPKISLLILTTLLALLHKSKLQLRLTPPIQATRPTTFTTTSAKSKKKKSAFNGLSKIAQLKQSWRDEVEAANANLEEEEDNQESKASLEISIANNDDPCYPCNQELFGHHIVTTLDLAED